MKTNYISNQLKQFLTASTLFLGVLAVSQVSYAGDRGGNGGSGGESEIAAEQAQLENVSIKIKHFFQKNGKELAPKFPEIYIPELIEKIETSRLQVVDEIELKDKHGKSRTCLNFPESNLIECKVSGISKLNDKPAALFVLVFHEYLGLLGVEETSPVNPEMIDGYSISKRIAPFVTKVSDYDLKLTQVVSTDKCRLFVGDINPEFAQILSDKGYSLFKSETKELKDGDMVLTRWRRGGKNRSESFIQISKIENDIEVLVGKSSYSYWTAQSTIWMPFEGNPVKAYKKLPDCK